MCVCAWYVCGKRRKRPPTSDEELAPLQCQPVPRPEELSQEVEHIVGHTRLRVAAIPVIAGEGETRVDRLRTGVDGGGRVGGGDTAGMQAR